MSKLKEGELLDCLDRVYKLIPEQAYQQIKEMIQKPGVTEEWIEEKAIRLFKVAYKWFRDETITSQQKIEIGQGFIRSLVEEMK